MKSKLEKWLNHEFSSGCCAGEDYLKFQKEAKAELKNVAKETGYVIHKFLGGHYEFSCVFKKEVEEKFCYVSISDVRFFKNRWWNSVLYRSMKHEKDFTGGMNHYCCWEDLGNSILELERSRR